MDALRFISSGVIPKTTLSIPKKSWTLRPLSELQNKNSGKKKEPTNASSSGRKEDSGRKPIAEFKLERMDFKSLVLEDDSPLQKTTTTRDFRKSTYVRNTRQTSGKGGMHAVIKNKTFKINKKVLNRTSDVTSFGRKGESGKSIADFKLERMDFKSLVLEDNSPLQKTTTTRNVRKTTYIRNTLQTSGKGITYIKPSIPKIQVIQFKEPALPKLQVNNKKTVRKNLFGSGIPTPILPAAVKQKTLSARPVSTKESPVPLDSTFAENEDLKHTKVLKPCETTSKSEWNRKGLERCVSILKDGVANLENHFHDVGFLTKQLQIISNRIAGDAQAPSAQPDSIKELSSPLDNTFREDEENSKCTEISKPVETASKSEWDRKGLQTYVNSLKERITNLEKNFHEEIGFIKEHLQIMSNHLDGGAQISENKENVLYHTETGTAKRSVSFKPCASVCEYSTLKKTFKLVIATPKCNSRRLVLPEGSTTKRKSNTSKTVSKNLEKQMHFLYDTPRSNLNR